MERPCATPRRVCSGPELGLRYGTSKRLVGPAHRSVSLASGISLGLVGRSAHASGGGRLHLLLDLLVDSGLPVCACSLHFLRSGASIVAKIDLQGIPMTTPAAGRE